MITIFADGRSLRTLALAGALPLLVGQFIVPEGIWDDLVGDLQRPGAVDLVNWKQQCGIRHELMQDADVCFEGSASRSALRSYARRRRLGMSDLIVVVSEDRFASDVLRDQGAAKLPVITASALLEGLELAGHVHSALALIDAAKEQWGHALANGHYPEARSSRPSALPEIAKSVRSGEFRIAL